MTAYREQRMTRARTMAARIIEEEWWRLPRERLVERVEMYGPAQIDDRGADWRMRCWGFQTTSTAGPGGAVANWARHVMRKTEAAE